MLTPRQMELLTFITEYVRRNKVPPSFDEMREALELRSKSGIHRLIQGLEERGFIRRLPYRARAIELLKGADGVGEPLAAEAPADSLPDDESNVVRADFQKIRTPEPFKNSIFELPLLGRIAAGSPIEALRDNSTMVQVPDHLADDDDHYVLEVVGDSMVDAGIFDGDLAVIKRCDTANSGAIVVALIDDREVTLKRIRRRGASIALEPANEHYETRIFGPHRVQVQGRLVGLMRRY